MPALAALLLQQANILYLHATIHGLAHIVNGQRRDAYGGQRLHFDTRFTRHFATGSQEYAVKVYQKLVELVRSKLGEDGVGLGQFGSGKIESGVTEIAMNPNFIPNTNHGVGGCKITSL